MQDAYAAELCAASEAGSPKTPWLAGIAGEAKSGLKIEREFFCPPFFEFDAMLVFRNSHILIVDNSAVARGIVRKLLAQLGYANIDEAADGADALAKLFAKTYDLVISDWNLDAADARALLKRLRESKEYAGLPFIAMTAKPAINKVVQAKRAGVTGFINKPFNAEALKAKIAEINA